MSFRAFKIVSLFGLAGAVSTLSLPAQTTWAVRNPVPTDSIIRKIIFEAGTFVAVGTAGAVLTSPDGANWTEQPRLDGRPTLTQIVYGGSQFVALDDHGVSYTSPDAVTWAPHVSSGGSGWALAFGNATYLTVSASNLFASSTDGITWVQRPTGTTLTGTSLTFGNGLFVVATNTNVYLTTPDGISWTAQSFPSGATVRQVVFGHGLFVALLANGLTASSTDAVTWQMLPDSRVMNGLGYANGLFFSSSDSSLYQSADGLNWTATGAQGFEGSAAATISFGNGAYVIHATYTGSAVHTALYSSPDAAVWTARSKAYEQVAGAAYGLGLFVAGSVVSSDGVTWSPGSFVSSLPPSYYGSSLYPYRVAFARDRFFAFQRDYPWGVYASTDGATSRALFSGTHLNAAAYGAGTYVLAGDYGVIFFSSDGTAWTRVAGAVLSTVTDLVFAQNLFVAATATNAVLTSPDGSNWTQQTIPAVGASSGARIAYGNGHFLLLRADGESLTSADGISWTARSTVAWSPAALAFANGAFVATAAGGALYTSTDGINWTARDTHASTTLDGLAFGNGQWVAAASTSSTILQSDTTSGAALPPTLAVPLLGRSVVGDGATPTILLVGVTGTGPFTFQWYRDGVEIAGATNQTYAVTLSPVFAAEAHDYRVVVTGAGGSVTSGTVVVTDVPPQAPVITTQPADTTVPVRATASFYVYATGAGPFTYEWRKNGQPLVASPSHPYLYASGPSLTLDNVSPADAGVYEVFVSNRGGGTLSREARLIVDYPRLVNLSARGLAGTGEDTMIQGFVLSGTPSSTPPYLLVRSVGPGLVGLGVTGSLADPSVRILNRAGDTVAENDNWSTQVSTGIGVPAIPADMRTVGAFPLADGSRDSAVALRDPPAGVYTALSSSADGGTGIVLTEIYGAPDSAQRLVNLSARARVGSGDAILIGGFVISGHAPLRVLLRAVGPGLANQAIAHPLANPKLTLFNSTGIAIGNNDTWGLAANVADVRSVSATVGAFPLAEGSNDAAMLVTLDPGVYTFQVTSVDGSSGIALAEIYEAP